MINGSLPANVMLCSVQTCFLVQDTYNDSLTLSYIEAAGNVSYEGKTKKFRCKIDLDSDNLPYKVHKLRIR